MTDQGDQDGNNPSRDSGDSRRKQTINWAYGLPIGLAIGIAMGIAMDNIVIGISIGIALGVAFGTAFNAQKSKDSDES